MSKNGISYKEGEVISGEVKDQFKLIYLNSNQMSTSSGASTSTALMEQKGAVDTDQTQFRSVEIITSSMAENNSLALGLCDDSCRCFGCQPGNETAVLHESGGLRINEIQHREDFSYNKKEKKKPKKKKKKGPKQQKMKAHFVPLKNSQGFEKRLCVFEPSINDLVFVPKKYGEVSKKERIREFCKHCKLTPCITIEHLDEIVDKWVDLTVGRNKQLPRLSRDAVVNRLEKFTMRFMTKYFGREYTQKHGMPECIPEDAVFHTKHEWHTRLESESEFSSGGDDSSSEGEHEF